MPAAVIPSDPRAGSWRIHSVVVLGAVAPGVGVGVGELKNPVGVVSPTVGHQMAAPGIVGQTVYDERTPLPKMYS